MGERKRRVIFELLPHYQHGCMGAHSVEYERRRGVENV